MDSSIVRRGTAVAVSGTQILTPTRSAIYADDTAATPRERR
jgi:hypothetical protein